MRYSVIPKTIFFVSATLLLPVLSVADETADVLSEKQDDTVDQKLSELLNDLGSDDFEQRVDGSTRLRKLNAEELKRCVQLVAKQPSAEAIVRLMGEIDDRYASQNPKDVAAASVALETFVEESRQLLADGAQQSLAQHWLRRMELAEQKLTSLGAIVKRGSLTQPQRMVGLPFGAAPYRVQVFIGEDWTGGSTGIGVFKRFTNLVGTGARGSGLSVYVLDGHPLKSEQLAELTELVGYIARRGRVALGIQPDVRMQAPHVLLGPVAPGGSAEAAGLEAGDLLVAIENPNKKNLKGEELEAVLTNELLRDFDDLVERLKQYKRGDVINVRVIRRYREQGMIFAPQRKLPEEIVKVTLKGWEALEAN